MDEVLHPIFDIALATLEVDTYAIDEWAEAEIRQAIADCPDAQRIDAAIALAALAEVVTKNGNAASGRLLRVLAGEAHTSTTRALTRHAATERAANAQKDVVRLGVAEARFQPREPASNDAVNVGVGVRFRLHTL